MDRSFLSNAEVVEASRNLVCIRMATYEDKEEAEFIKKIYKSRSGSLENTVFAILTPDGKDTLIRPGRGPHQFRDPKQLARKMNSIAKSNTKPNPDSDKSDPVIPFMKNFKLALNVAAAERLPLIAAVAPKADLEKLHEGIGKKMLDEPFQGQFIYVSTDSMDDLKPITGDTTKPGIYVIQPEQFGVSGKVVSLLAADSSENQIELALKKSMNGTLKRVNQREHVRKGIRKGLDWESEIPASDPKSMAARERIRSRGGRRGGGGGRTPR